MKLKTDELRKFLSIAGQIRPNPLAQHLDSIKIQCTGNEIIFYKTNNNIWVKYSYICQPTAPETFFINEKMLNGVILTSKEYELEIVEEIDGSIIRIYSGERVLKVIKQDDSLFPVIQEAAGEKIKIEKATVERIRIASRYISTAVNKTALNFVNIGDNGIFAFNGSIAYYHKTLDLPLIYFDEEPLNTIRATDDMIYWTSATYDFFQLNEFTFGFIKTSLEKPLPFLGIVQQKGADFFSIKKQELMDFCTVVQYSKKKENPIASFMAHEAGALLKLKFADAAFNIDYSQDTEVESTGEIHEFNFNVDQLMLMLKTLPYDVLIFTKLGNGHYGVSTKEDDGYMGILARLA